MLYIECVHFFCLYRNSLLLHCTLYMYVSKVFCVINFLVK